ncbi:MAG: hypothetical protein JOZ10_03680 [Acidobacteria bacterium]|nr:hypothetical protein [Acidobacteriota bacterium]
MKVYGEESVLVITPDSVVQAAEVLTSTQWEELRTSARFVAAWNSGLPGRPIPVFLEDTGLEHRQLIGLILLIDVARQQSKVALVRDAVRYLHQPTNELFTLLSRDCRIWVVPPVKEAVIQ